MVQKAVSHAYSFRFGSLDTDKQKRIAVFPGGDAYHTPPDMEILGLGMKKANLASDVINFGDRFMGKKKLFDTMIEHADNNGNCNICHVPPELSVREALSRSRIITPRGGGSSSAKSASLSLQHDRVIQICVKASTKAPDIPGDCSFCQRVLLTLAVKKRYYKTHFINLDNQPEWFVAVNPDGILPLIKFDDDDKWYSNSDDIVEMIDEKYPQTSLLSPPRFASVYEVTKLKMKVFKQWLKDKFEAVQEGISADDIAPYVRGYLMYLIGTKVLPNCDKPTHYPAYWLHFLEDLSPSKLNDVAWGAAALAMLHTSLTSDPEIDLASPKASSLKARLARRPSRSARSRPSALPKPIIISVLRPHCWKGSASKPYVELPPHTAPLGMETHRDHVYALECHLEECYAHIRAHQTQLQMHSPLLHTQHPLHETHSQHQREAMLRMQTRVDSLQRQLDARVPKPPIAPEEADAMAARDAARSHDGDDNQNSGTTVRRTPRECTYLDYMKCQPLSFKCTEGVVELMQWFEKTESVFRISHCITENQIGFATCTLHGSALTWWNSLVSTMGQDRA
ncbi:dehydroascorbate reductase 2 [Tanacetum coccineum]